MNFLNIIAERRDGRTHTEEELRFLANGAADGSIPDYQLAAWLMAAYIHPLADQETAWLTAGMADSGDRIDLSGLPHPWVDKHSTGGVGDKTSLVLMPLLAACGLTMVKMSGRGLGITGGTVDKLASIPDFRLDLSPEEMIAQAKKIGLALTGQTPRLAPADKALYALRDATATVASMPLIVSSILSKKIAGGAEIVSLDVKCGSGAFMTDFSSARALATLLVKTGELSGLKVTACITDMDQPLGSAVGNALEVAEAFDVLSNKELSPAVARFKELCLELAAHTLAVAKGDDQESSRELAELVLTSGAAAEKAREWVAAQGGNPLVVVDPWSILPSAMVRREVVCTDSAGWVQAVRADLVGQAVVDLGGGREAKTDIVDPTVGIEMKCLIGSELSSGQAIAIVHAKTEADALAAAATIQRAVSISSRRIEPRPLILGVL